MTQCVTSGALIYLSSHFSVKATGREETMKYSAIVALLLVASATSFAPASNSGRTSTSLAATKKAESAKKKSLFSQIADMDLFAPNPDVNTYGARSKKNMKVGKITSNSYVPAGLTKAQYEKIRSEEKAKKEARYKEKMAKVRVLLCHCRCIQLSEASPILFHL